MNIETVDFQEQLVGFFDSTPSVNQVIPPEIIERVFLKLNGNELKPLCMVNRLWNGVFTEIAKRKELAHMVKFSNFLEENLNNVSVKQKLRSLEIKNDRKVLSSNRMGEVKFFISQLKEDIATVLKDLPETDLKKLEELFKNEPKSILIENIFSIVQLYSELDQIKLINNEFSKNQALSKLSTNLFRKSCVRKAFEVACMIISDFQRSVTLRAMPAKLIAYGMLDLALDVSNKITFFSCSEIYPVICQKFIERGDLEKALKVADRSYSDFERSAQEKIYKLFLERDNLDKAFEVANSIRSNWYRKIALKEVFKTFLQKGFINKAIELARSMTWDSDQALALKVICNLFLEIGSMDQALEAANMIRWNFKRKKTLEKIYEIP